MLPGKRGGGEGAGAVCDGPRGKAQNQIARSIQLFILMVDYYQEKFIYPVGEAICVNINPHLVLSATHVSGRTNIMTSQSTPFSANSPVGSFGYLQMTVFEL